MSIHTTTRGAGRTPRAVASSVWLTLGTAAVLAAGVLAVLTGG